MTDDREMTQNADDRVLELLLRAPASTDGPPLLPHERELAQDRLLEQLEDSKLRHTPLRDLH